MCGILGIYNLQHKDIFHQQNFESALLTMVHRGPDAHRVNVFNMDAILGHVRLSIIDLSEENAQPFQVDNRFWIVYNGEIYNYLELKTELIAAGYLFRTSGDTEVVLRAYQYWGAECVSKFNGMWAFAIYDKVDQKLFCSRDRFGIKPFYYAIINGQLIFSSEIKGIISYFPQLKTPNYNIISNYCRKSIGAQTEQTWFENILRLEPAFNMFIDSNGIKKYRYWDYPRKVDNQITISVAVETYRQILTDSLKLRMRSDVPVGFTLSSGIDSSSIVCLLKGQFSGNKNTYTAAFSNLPFHRLEKQNFRENITINEPELVKKLTAELDLTPYIIDIKYDNYTDDLKKIIHFLESGHGSPAIFPLSQILKEAKNDVTVVLEGQGADELLGGYINDAFPVYFLELLKKFRLVTALQELKAFAKVYSLKIAFMLYVRQSNFNFIKKLYYKISGIEAFYDGKLKHYTELNDYPIEPEGFDDRLNEHLYKAHTGGLVSLLHYGDAISMSYSMESRQPFMDYRLIEFVFTLPSRFKLHQGMGKYLHRLAMQGIVPDYIINNPIKFGFDSPLSEMFLREGENSAMAILLSDKCIKRGLFCKQALIKAFKEQKSGKKDHSRFLFRMLNVELWFREFIDEN
jgi:asparagine synthase (glutamine-hydrolysing)